MCLNIKLIRPKTERIRVARQRKCKITQQEALASSRFWGIEITFLESILCSPKAMKAPGGLEEVTVHWRQKRTIPVYPEACQLSLVNDSERLVEFKTNFLGLLVQDFLESMPRRNGSSPCVQKRTWAPLRRAAFCAETQVVGGVAGPWYAQWR